MKKVLLPVVLVIFSTFFSLFLVEIVLRIVTPQPEGLAKLKSSSKYIHENKPNAVFQYTNNEEYNLQITLNSYGFRDTEFSREKPPGVIRVAVLGDSQEEALQVPLDKTWQKVMAARLSEQLGEKALSPEVGPRRVETYNFGISGYGTDQQWLTLTEKVWQFSPDMVLLAFSPNDVGDTYKNKIVRLENDKIHVVDPKERAGGNALGRFVRETYMYHLIQKASAAHPFATRAFNKVRTVVLGFPKEERITLSDAQLVQGPFEVIASQKNPPSEVTETWKVVQALILDMQKQASDHNTKFLVTINIPRAQVQDSDWVLLQNQYHIDPNSSPYQINTSLGDFIRERGVTLYDPREDAIAWYRQKGILHLPKDGHFNENGNEFMGTKVADYIIQNGILEK